MSRHAAGAVLVLMTIIIWSLMEVLINAKAKQKKRKDHVKSEENMMVHFRLSMLDFLVWA